MRLERGDAYVAMVVLAGLAIAVGAFYWLTNPSDDYFALFVEYERVEGLNEQTPVRLHGFPVGRIQEIHPQMTDSGAVVFRVELRIDQELIADSAVFIPMGTQARVDYPPVVGSPFIVLEPPATGGAPLPSGSPIPGLRTDPFLKQIQLQMGSLTFNLTQTLLRATELMDTVEAAIGRVDRTVALAEARIPDVLDQLDSTIASAEALTRRIQTEVETTSPTVRSTLDSASVLMGDSRRVLGNVGDMVTDTEPRLEQVLQELDELIAILNHLVTQISERPLRILTGVEPLGGKP